MALSSYLREAGTSLDVRAVRYSIQRRSGVSGEYIRLFAGESLRTEPTRVSVGASRPPRPLL